MKTFNNLKFKSHQVDGIHAEMKFRNGFSVSVIRTSFSYGGKSGLYELAVKDKNGDLDYSTPVTSDVEGYLSEANVTRLMEEVQQLPKS